MHSDDSVPRRLLTAWGHNAQEALITTAAVSEDRLFVVSCALRQHEIAFDLMPALRSIPKAERSRLTVDEDGSYLHWPGPDIHIDLDAIRAAIDPKGAAWALADRARHHVRYGAAIARLRVAKGLKQSGIEGLSERQVRRIEKGEGASAEALRLMASAHGMRLDEYLRAVAESA